MKHNRENYEALLKSIIGNLKSIIGNLKSIIGPGLQAALMKQVEYVEQCCIHG